MVKRRIVGRGRTNIHQVGWLRIPMVKVPKQARPISLSSGLSVSRGM